MNTIKDFKVGDKVVPIDKRRKNKVWVVIGFSNVFAEHIIITTDDERLCYHEPAKHFEVLE